MVSGRPSFIPQGATSPLHREKKRNTTDLEAILTWAGIIVFGALAIAGLIALVALAFYAA
jgi:hypothetical protein